MSHLTFLLHGQAKLHSFKGIALSCKIFWKLSMWMRLESFTGSQQFFGVYVWATGTSILCAIAGTAERQMVTFFSKKMVDGIVGKYITSWVCRFLQINTLSCRCIRYKNTSKDRTFARSSTSVLLIALKQHSFLRIGWSNSFLSNVARKFGSVTCPVLSITNETQHRKVLRICPNFLCTYFFHTLLRVVVIIYKSTLMVTFHRIQFFCLVFFQSELLAPSTFHLAIEAWWETNWRSNSVSWNWVR